jgi:hypothetical protein
MLAVCASLTIYRTPIEGQTTIDYQLKAVHGCLGGYVRPEVRQLTTDYLNQRITSSEYIAGAQSFHPSLVNKTLCVVDLFEERT